MSRREGTCRASYRAVTTEATATSSAHHPVASAPTRNTTPAVGGRGLKRAACYARVSIDTQAHRVTTDAVG
jgi:hypothetical protein